VSKPAIRKGFYPQPGTGSKVFLQENLARILTDRKIELWFKIESTLSPYCARLGAIPPKIVELRSSILSFHPWNPSCHSSPLARCYKPPCPQLSQCRASGNSSTPGSSILGLFWSLELPLIAVRARKSWLPPQAILEPSLAVFSSRVRVIVATASFLGFEPEPPWRVTHGSKAPAACPWHHHEQRAHRRSYSSESLALSHPMWTTMIRS
jgi:hypothetical protein